MRTATRKTEKVVDNLPVGNSIQADSKAFQDANDTAMLSQTPAHASWENAEGVNRDTVLYTQTQPGVNNQPSYPPTKLGKQ